ncbi:DMT family transporter [Bacillus sp. T33-2]|uniref:DMT family transporter n=1 Tax=Bacillus sp. T33-2 TaxID=2054168 RepID=UPI000C76F401|nr:multidrug efflux SMR transporter [Bacillus sp. T33-2]PLR96788.1 QacE family quaternary ammonium compound efflux SMR transporter [Bacillus sp. T33-2]
MYWLFLFIAGIGEIIGVAGINQLNKKGGVSSFLLFFAGFVLSFGFLTLAMKGIEMSTAYAIWTGIGTAGSALLGMIFFGESRSWKRIACMCMVLFAVVGLKLLSHD